MRHATRAYYAVVFTHVRPLRAAIALQRPPRCQRLTSPGDCHAWRDSYSDWQQMGTANSVRVGPMHNAAMNTRR